MIYIKVLIVTFLLGWLFNYLKKKIQIELSALKTAFTLEKEKLISDDNDNPFNVKSKGLEEMRSHVKNLSIEAEKLNNPSTFGKYSKLQREINVIKAKIEAAEQEVELLKSHSGGDGKNKERLNFLDQKLGELEKDKKLLYLTRVQMVIRR